MKEIVINIDDTIYNRIVNMNEFLYYGTFGYLLKAVKNGKELPKGHGELKDVKDISKLPSDCTYHAYGCNNLCHCGDCTYAVVSLNAIKNVNTIVEADKGMWNEDNH